MSPEDSRSMCFSGHTPIIYKDSTTGRISRTTLLGLYEKKQNIEIPCNGKWLPAKPVKVKLTKEKFITVQLRNGVELMVTDNHQHLTKDGLKLSSQLTTEDYLAISRNMLPWQGEGNYELGKMLGWYLAEGSHSGTDIIQFSLGDKDTEALAFLPKWFSENLGAHCSIVQNTGKSKSVFVNAEGTYKLISRFIHGKAKNKRLINWWKLSQSCLQGLWDGWKAGDGSGQEIYTSSKELVNQMLEIANILGIKCNIKAYYGTSVLNGKSYTGWSYALNICKLSSAKGRIYFDTFDDKYYYVKIEKIKQNVSNAKVAYCVEMQGKDPYFELPSGVITHNCCRLRLSTKELHKRGGGLFGSSGLTGSIGVVTINLPLLAYEANGSMDKFYTLISTYMDLAKDALETKRKFVETNTEKGLYPYSRHYLQNIKSRDNMYWANHFSTIGLIGMNEAAMMLGVDYVAEEGKVFGAKVLRYMNNKILKFQEQTKNFYNLEATPAEGASYKLALKSKKKYTNITTAGDTKPYFTNSTMLPVGHSSNIFEVLEHQNELQALYTGGTVIHIYLGEKSTAEQVKLLVKKVLSKYSIPYISITPTFSVCPKHGYMSGEHALCPQCTKDVESIKGKIKKLKEEEKHE
jgi:ribonucleoside-triphosphate reductase